MTPHTLLGLACIIANNGSLDTSALKAQLSEAEQAQVEAIIESGACLPQKLEALLSDTKLKIESGELKIERVGNPTNDCF